jgi:membrane-associated protein
MVAHLGRLIGEYGYLIVALFIFFEGIAIPFPTDSTLVTAAAFAARGRLSIAIIFVISTIAATAGTTIAFMLGRRGGAFFEVHAQRASTRALVRTRSFFDRHGDAAVAAGRFIPVARMLISPMAGLSTMSLSRFTFFNAIGAAIWSVVFCGIGYFFGKHPPAFGHGLVRAALVVAVGLALLVTVAVAGGWLVEESDAAWRAEGTLWHRVLITPPVRWLAGHSPRARAFLFRRFSPGDYLGLHLTLGLGLSLIALLIFGDVMNLLLTSAAVPHFDIALAAALRETASPRSDAWWRVVSGLDAIPVVILPGLALGLLLVPRRGWLPFIGWSGAMIGTLVLDRAAQYFVFPTRSAIPAPAAFAWGTPSGRAIDAVVGYGMAAYLLILLAPRHRTGIVAVASVTVLVLAACFGRLYLGEGYFSDLVSGIAAGCMWLSASLTGLEVARRRAEQGRRSTPSP